MAFFTSTDQTITSGGTLTLAHGLGAVPKMAQVFLVCQTANNGYSVGDVVTPVDISINAADKGCVMKVDATNVTVYIASAGAAGSFYLLTATGGSVGNAFVITDSQWKLRIIAQT